MTGGPLGNLVKIGRLKAEAPARAEFEGMVDSGRKRLADARNEKLAPESRFDLAYGAAHALALAAMRHKGYRPENRTIVFQALVHTAGTSKEDVQIFSKAHNERNLAEYEGRTVADPKLLADLIRCTTELETIVAGLIPPKDGS